METQREKIIISWRFLDEIKASVASNQAYLRYLPPPLNSEGTVHYCIHDNSRVLLHNSSAEQWRGRGLNTSVVTLTWLTNSFDTPLSYPTTFLKGADSSLAVCGKKKRSEMKLNSTLIAYIQTFPRCTELASNRKRIEVGCQCFDVFSPQFIAYELHSNLIASRYS